MEKSDNPEEALRENKIFRKGFIMLFGPKETGQGLTEYAIILALVALIVIAVVRLLGPTIGNTFSSINSSIPS
jgi:pilus assembly protein Flp/PilA